MKNYKPAEIYTRKALDLSIQLRNREQMMESYVNLSSIYEAMGNTEKALVNYKLYHATSDTITISKYEQSTLELEERFQSAKSQKEIELLSNLNTLKTKENNTQKNVIKKNRIIIICGILLTIIIAFLAFLFYKNFRKTQKLNELLTNKNELIEYQKKDILDSILYARRIQNSILPQEQELKRILPKHFIIYKPRNIVSGDFYWLNLVKSNSLSHKNVSIFAICDCTGHGVPGAFMSLISYTLLNQVIKDPETNNTGAVLNYLAKELPVALKSEGNSSDLRDGLDIAVGAIDYQSLTFECSMAHIPVYICNGKELRVIKPDKQSISANNYNNQFKFNIKTEQLQKGDRIYVSTDGFADQFGGPEGKKLKSKELKKILLQTHYMPLHEQKIKLESLFDSWKANLEQVDDVTLIGIEV
ncbi:MAG: SpoIIE family protein phosphatase [Bacteroidetes bacterium]|nr:SpoIIE family protein phosphatase [Bacteroidota bacterium]